MQEEKKTRKKCDSITSYFLCAFMVFTIFTILICAVKYIVREGIKKNYCKEQLRFIPGNPVYVKDDLENIHEGFTIVCDNVSPDSQKRYVILEVNRSFSGKAMKTVNHRYEDIARKITAQIEHVTKNDDNTYTEIGNKSKFSILTNGGRQEGGDGGIPKDDITTAVDAQIVKIKGLEGKDNKVKEQFILIELYRSSIKTRKAAIKILDNVVNSSNTTPENKIKFSNESHLLKVEVDRWEYELDNLEQELKSTIISNDESKRLLIAVPRENVYHLDSLHACLIGNDPLGLFRMGEDKEGKKSEIFRKWKKGEKPEQDKYWYEKVPFTNFFFGDSKISNQVNYFIYMLFVPINRICCYLQQLTFNKMETLCKILTSLDEAIQVPFLFPENHKEVLEREISNIEYEIRTYTNKTENELLILRKKKSLYTALKTTTSDQIKQDIDYIEKLVNAKKVLTKVKKETVKTADTVVNEAEKEAKKLVDEAENLVKKDYSDIINTDFSNYVTYLEELTKTLTEIKTKLHIDNSYSSSIGYVIETFLNFTWIFFKNVTLTIFSIIVHYITLFLDIIEVTFTSFLMVSSGVEAQKGSVGQIFSGLVGSCSKLLENPAVLTGLGFATSGLGAVLVKGLSITGGAASAAMNANNEARMYGEQFKAQGFSNMAGFVAKNPTGVVFFTTKFIKLFYKFGIIGPFTLMHRMTETLCDYTGLSKDADEDVDEAGRKAAEIMLKQLNDSIVKATDDFSSMNKKAMKTSWNGIKSSATRFMKSTKKFLSSSEKNNIDEVQEEEEEEKQILPPQPKRKARSHPTKKSSLSGIDKANILTNKRNRNPPTRYQGGKSRMK
jgi:hypothetical protein